MAPYAAMITAGHWGGDPDAESQSRFATTGQNFEAMRFEAAILRRGLAAPTSRGLWRLDPSVRSVILMAYCRALHREVQGAGIALQPVMIEMQDFPEIFGPMRDGRTSARWQRSRNTHRVINADWRRVGVDLSAVPLDEVLDFRNQHGRDFRAYARGLRDLVRDGAEMSDAQFAAELRARNEQFEWEASELRRTLTGAFGRIGAATLLTVAGSIWTASQGDILGALFAASAASATLAPPARPVTAYSYLFRMRQEFPPLIDEE